MEEKNIQIELLEQPDGDWDKRVLENNGQIYQTTTFATIQEQALGMKSFYIIAKHNSKIVGQLLVNCAPLFYKYLKDKHKKWFRFFWKHFKTYLIVRGPIIIDKSLKKEIHMAFLDYLENYIKKTKGFMLQDISLQIGEDENIFSLFISRGFYSNSWGTIIVDLKQPLDILWKNLQKSRRHLIRNGLKHGLILREAKTKEDYDKVISIIKDMSKRNEVLAYTPEYYNIMFKILSERKMMCTFFIEKDGREIATISIFIFGKQIVQTFIAHTDYSVKEKMFGVDLIEWFIIKWAHLNGYSTYDLAGIRPESMNKKEIGITEYKRRWGGKEIHFPYFTKKYSSLKSFLASSFKGIAKSIKFGIEK